MVVTLGHIAPGEKEHTNMSRKSTKPTSRTSNRTLHSTNFDAVYALRRGGIWVITYWARGLGSKRKRIGSHLLAGVPSRDRRTVIVMASAVLDEYERRLDSAALEVIDRAALEAA